MQNKKYCFVTDPLFYHNRSEISCTHISFRYLGCYIIWMSIYTQHLFNRQLRTYWGSQHYLLIYTLFKILICVGNWYFIKLLLNILEGTASYAGILLAPAEGFGLRPMLFLPFWAFYAVFAYFRPFWCSVVTSASLSSNLSNLEKRRNKNLNKI